MGLGLRFAPLITLAPGRFAPSAPSARFVLSREPYASATARHLTLGPRPNKPVRGPARTITYLRLSRPLSGLTTWLSRIMYIIWYAILEIEKISIIRQ